MGASASVISGSGPYKLDCLVKISTFKSSWAVSMRIHKFRLSCIDPQISWQIGFSMSFEETSDSQHYLEELSWQFEGELFEDKAKFERSAREYQLEITGNADDWRPLELLAPDTHIRIRFPVCSSEKDIELEVELWSSSAHEFNNLDIMFQFTTM